MDGAGTMDDATCLRGGEELVNPLLAMGTQVSCLLVISHFFQLLLKPFGQPASVAQILAGFVLGPSGLSHLDVVKGFFFSISSTDFYETMALYSRIVIMFLIGLETDVPYLRRNIRETLIISGASSFICTVFATAVTTFIFDEMGGHGSAVLMGMTLTIILSNTASPFVARMTHDLRFASTDIGRLAISSSLISDAYAVFLLIIMSKEKNEHNGVTWFFYGVLHFIVIIAVVMINKYVSVWLNKRHRNLKYLKSTEISVLLAILFIGALVLETMGYSSVVACFLIGAMFPRGGKTCRTLLTKLSYFIYNFVLPIYFGYGGFKADISLINNFRYFAVVAVVILLSFGGKVTGTLIACFHLKIPLNEGVLLAFLMNLKGHVDLLALSVSVESKGTLSNIFYSLMIAAIVVNSLIWGPVIAFMVRRETDIFGYRHVPFEFQLPDSELKLLAGVYDPRPVATMIGLIGTCKGPEKVAITPYLMNLIELLEKTKTNLLYNQKEEDELSDDESYGGNDVVEINEAVDIFAGETGLLIHQVKIVAPFKTLYEDVCDFAEYTRSSLIILPFHKHQRIDGKLESGKDGIRTTNQKVLRYARCSVAILVDRGLTAGGLDISGSGSLQHLGMLFFGGPDDREALGLSKRIGMHHRINLTVIRFLPKVSKLEDNREIDVARKEEDLLMDMLNHESQHDAADNAAITDFFNKYVTSGEVGYVEKHVEDGRQTGIELEDMAEMYSMFIVGRWGRENSNLTTGMSDWEECPELGKVGDFLASEEFDHSGSVLVVQQYKPSRHGDDDDDDQ